MSQGLDVQESGLRKKRLISVTLKSIRNSGVCMCGDPEIGTKMVVL